MITYNQYECPACNKRRMLRPEGHKVSMEKTKKELSSGEIIEHFRDVCEPCMNKLIRLYYTPKRTDVRKVLSAIENGEPLREGSLEELL